MAATFLAPLLHTPGYLPVLVAAASGLNLVFYTIEILKPMYYSSARYDAFTCWDRSERTMTAMETLERLYSSSAGSCTLLSGPNRKRFIAAIEEPKRLYDSVPGYSARASWRRGEDDYSSHRDGISIRTLRESL